MQQVHVVTWIAPIVIDVQNHTNSYSTRQKKATIEDIVGLRIHRRIGVLNLTFAAVDMANLPGLTSYYIYMGRSCFLCMKSRRIHTATRTCWSKDGQIITEYRVPEEWLKTHLASWQTDSVLVYPSKVETIVMSACMCPA